MALLDCEIFRIILAKITALETKIAKQKEDLDLWTENYGDNAAGGGWAHTESRNKYYALHYELDDYYNSLGKEGVQVNTIKEVLALRKAKNRVAFAHYWKLAIFIEGNPNSDSDSSDGDSD